MALGVLATSRKGWFEGRWWFLILLCNRNAISPSGKELHHLFAQWLTPHLCRFLRSVRSFGADSSVSYFCLFVGCLPLHTTQYGVSATPVTPPHAISHTALPWQMGWCVYCCAVAPDVWTSMACFCLAACVRTT